jgi:glutamate racemase
MGRDVVLVSSADETAFAVREMLPDGGDASTPPGAPTFITSGDVNQFRRLGARFLGPEVQAVEAWSWS